MRTRKFHVVVAALLFLFVGSFNPIWAQGTAFTYQGRLETSGVAANGNFDFQFSLFGTNEAGTALAPDLTNGDVNVSGGLFTATLDFGAEALVGTNVWLDIAVRSHGSTGAFTELSPRQLLTAAPFAVTAASLAGVVANNEVAAGVTNTTIGGGVENMIAAAANGATIGGGQANVIGSNSVIAVIAGGANNSVGANDDTSTIAGGNGNVIQNGAGVSTIGGGVQNIISTQSPRSVIAGGANNRIGTNSQYSVIGGGANNGVGSGSQASTITGGVGSGIGFNSQYSVIGGGNVNQIASNSVSCLVGGGDGNLVGANSSWGMIGGGYYNAIGAGSDGATIGGGTENIIGTNDGYSNVGGGTGNIIGFDSYYSSIVGGRINNVGLLSSGTVIGGGLVNIVGTNSSGSTIAGGSLNSIGNGTAGGTISGGYNNNVEDGAYGSTIVGGANNVVGTNAPYSFIGGGELNSVGSNSVISFIGGGSQNTIELGRGSTIGGGANNLIEGTNSVIAGGYANYIQGNNSFAAGENAIVLNNNCFLWSDLGPENFQTTSSNQFLVRASGGVGIDTENPEGASLYVRGGQDGGTFANATVIIENTNTTGTLGSPGSGPALRVVLDGGSGIAGALSVSDNGTGPIARFGNGISFVATIDNDGTLECKALSTSSDRNVKEHFAALDTERVLEKVAGLPVTEWNYKTDVAGVRHIGPVAQDFSATFGLNGADDKHISVVDEGGVALAAIQGLNAKLEAEVTDLRAQNEKLEKRLANIEATLGQSKN